MDPKLRRRLETAKVVLAVLAGVALLATLVTAVWGQVAGISRAGEVSCPGRQWACWVDVDSRRVLWGVSKVTGLVGVGLALALGGVASAGAVSLGRQRPRDDAREAAPKPRLSLRLVMTRILGEDAVPKADVDLKLLACFGVNLVGGVVGTAWLWLFRSGFTGFTFAVGLTLVSMLVWGVVLLWRSRARPRRAAWPAGRCGSAGSGC